MLQRSGTVSHQKDVSAQASADGMPEKPEAVPFAGGQHTKHRLLHVMDVICDLWRAEAFRCIDEAILVTSQTVICTCRQVTGLWLMPLWWRHMSDTKRQQNDEYFAHKCRLCSNALSLCKW